jgi:hypothetical protein
MEHLYALLNNRVVSPGTAFSPWFATKVTAANGFIAPLLADTKKSVSSWADGCADSREL